MAGAFSGHLLDSFERSNIISSGSMSFNPNMHGTQQSGYQSQPFTMFTSQANSSMAFQDLSDATAIKIATLQAKLNQKLGPEYISQRPGPGGMQKLTYAEGWKIINLANEVFGFNGWSSNIVSLTTDFMDYSEESKRYNLGVSAVVRVTLRDGVYHEDVGYGMIENTRSKGQGLDKCKKEAVTDGLKRALRSFGNLLGNCLYDKTYTSEVVKIKVPPPKFNKDELHRRPEFQDVKPNIASTSASACHAPTTHHTSSSSTSISAPPRPQNAQHNLPPVSVKREPASANVSFQQNSRPGQAPSNPNPNPKPQTMAPPPPMQSRPPPVQAQSNAPNRQVTFAPPPQAGPSTTNGAAVQNQDPDDSFGFSDDDAFLAALGDLDGDVGPPIDSEGLGRPIEEDTDMGPPLHYPDTTAESISAAAPVSVQAPPSASAHRAMAQQGGGGGASNGSGRSFAGIQGNHRPSASGSGSIPPTGGMTRLEAIMAAQKMEQERIEQEKKNGAGGSSSVTMGSSSDGEGQGSSAPAAGPSRISLPQSSSGHAAGGQQPQQRQYQQQQQARQGMTSGARPNENKEPAYGQQQQQRPQQRSVTPVGGFHFPPVVNNPMMQNRSGQGVNSGATQVGMKRPLESSVVQKGHISSSGSMRPGMGLQQATGVERQVLGRLDVDGIDPKRIRR